MRSKKCALVEIKTVLKKVECFIIHGYITINRKLISSLLNFSLSESFNQFLWLFNFFSCFSIPNNFRKIVFQTVIKYGNETDWFHMLEKAKSSLTNSEKMTFLKSLSYTKNYDLLKL